jgi:hypothetical protein
MFPSALFQAIWVGTSKAPALFLSLCPSAKSQAERTKE